MAHGGRVDSAMWALLVTWYAVGALIWDRGTSIQQPFGSRHRRAMRESTASADSTSVGGRSGRCWASFPRRGVRGNKGRVPDQRRSNERKGGIGLPCSFCGEMSWKGRKKFREVRSLQKI